MDFTQAFRACIRRDLISLNFNFESSLPQLISRKYLSYSPSRRKPNGTIISSRSLKTSSSSSSPSTPISNTSSQPTPATSPTSPPSQPPTRPNQSSQASAWNKLFTEKRPHGIQPSPTAQDPAKLQNILNNIIDMVPQRSPTTSLSAQLSRDIDRMDQDEMNSKHLRLGPMLGRTQMVDPVAGPDLQTSIRMLESRLAQNKVRTDEIAQRFHVRRGQVRKNLKAKRWRALFKQGFIAEVGRVRRMKWQGW